MRFEAIFHHKKPKHDRLTKVIQASGLKGRIQQWTDSESYTDKEDDDSLQRKRNHRGSISNEDALKSSRTTCSLTIESLSTSRGAQPKPMWTTTAPQYLERPDRLDSHPTHGKAQDHIGPMM
eukprot:4359886-Amphidinium_carterae.2